MEFNQWWFDYCNKPGFNPELASRGKIARDTWAAAKAASADVDGEAIWQRFIDHLNAVEPIVFKKADGSTAFLGSIEKYKRIFIESQRANSPRGNK